jgi:hypothetical protein
MIWQLHWQYKDGHTEFKSQHEFAEGDDMPKEVTLWIDAARISFPLPEGVQWLMVSEESEYFTRGCPYPIKGDDGTAQDCIDKGHCACEERKK